MRKKSISFCEISSYSLGKLFGRIICKFRKYTALIKQLYLHWFYKAPNQIIPFVAGRATRLNRFIRIKHICNGHINIRAALIILLNTNLAQGIELNRFNRVVGYGHRYQTSVFSAILVNIGIEYVININDATLDIHLSR